MLQERVTEELEIDVDTLAKLQALADQNNMTVDEVINEILIRHMSTKISIEEYKNILNENDHKKIADYYIIIDDNEKPIARIMPA